ncbi:MAG: two-component system histidine kinase PnpS [Limnochordia bacterium]|jgi:two-component system phosphate regulon sensor histidine kinase PhoR
MREPNFLPAIPTAIGIAGASLLTGVLIALGLWEMALPTAILTGYFIWQIARRTKAIINSLIRLREAVKQLPEGNLPGLSTAPGVELARLATALDEMVSRIREELGKLEHDRDRLGAVFTSMRDAVITTGKTGRVALINPAAERLFQVKAEDVVGRSVLEVIRHHQLAYIMQSTMTTGLATTLEFETFDVPPRHFQVEIAPVHNMRGKRSGAVAVLHDVTELRQLERIRTEFVANVSHELRTPITSIRGYLETLLDGAMDDHETCRHFLTVLNDEAERLTNLVNDLLDLSHLEEDNAQPEVELIEVAAAAERCLELIAPLAQEKEIAISQQISPGLFVKMNGELLRQAIINLLDNAVKYTPTGGKVWIEADRVPEGNTVQIKVCDTGPGIPSQHLNRLFERFYRVDKARSRALGGTGLGLSIVKHIVESSGGQVWAESTLGKGSCFIISLDGYDASGAPFELAPEPEPPQQEISSANPQ